MLPNDDQQNYSLNTTVLRMLILKEEKSKSANSYLSIKWTQDDLEKIILFVYFTKTFLWPSSMWKWDYLIRLRSCLDLWIVMRGWKLYFQLISLLKLMYLLLISNTKFQDFISDLLQWVLCKEYVVWTHQNQCFPTFLNLCSCFINIKVSYFPRILKAYLLNIIIFCIFLPVNKLYFTLVILHSNNNII